MIKKPASIFFDTNDYQLLTIVNDVLDRAEHTQTLRSLFSEHMHPHGIKEMAAARGLRIAYAIASLLGSFEQGAARNRINALRSLRDEVFLSSTSFYQKNTARVLLQIMKELLRSRDNQLRQLKLAHDFRMVSTGNPRKVREELAKYHLLEMPEEWNQSAFDNHVHDANTKGRKSATHLVMDAWIKGIRQLTVIYYNYVNPDVVEELVEASAILKVRVQVGIEMSCRYRDKYVRFTWEPHGFNDNRAFLKFLGEEAVMQFMEEGRKVSRYQQKYVFEVLDVFNSRHRQRLNTDLELDLEPLRHDAFVQFVGAGQPSTLHLARFIYNAIIAQITSKADNYLLELNTADTERRLQLHNRFQRINGMTIDRIMEQFLTPAQNPEIYNPSHPRETPHLPALLQVDLRSLLNRLLSLHSSSQFTLNLSNLSDQDTLELLYACEGMISHIEAYNLKDADHGISPSHPADRGHYQGDAVDSKSPARHYSIISELQQALNDDNVISLKRVIRAIIWDFDEQILRLSKQMELFPPQKEGKEKLEQEHQQMLVRKSELLDILYNLETFHNYYSKRILGARIGSGSTGQSESHYGMGLAVLETLPSRAVSTATRDLAEKKRTRIPVSALLTSNTHRCYHDSLRLFTKKSLFHMLPFFPPPYRQWNDWQVDGFLVHPERPGNIITLGGKSRGPEPPLLLPHEKMDEKLEHPWKYLNTNLKNTLKVLLGFIPAFLTFMLTKDWWFLAYFGAFIWFAITGSRNIIQSILGGGGLRRSPLLPWNSLISWSRIADSLLYTGFSVPILDYLVKTLLLDQTFAVTTSTNPVLLYSVMGLANGIYISSHNSFRGLPRTAVVGNFFRSILAIPLAIALNSTLAAFLPLFGVADVTAGLQKWAAIISKFASDIVAAAIEGLADRQTNIRLRLAGYRTKISQLFGVFSRLDLQFPEEDVLDMLQSPKVIMETLNYEAREQEKLIIVNALDLMYFWMYQPRARRALTTIAEKMSQEEWLIFYRSQLVLKRHREISQVFVDGLVGKNFSKPLAFYLDRAEEYLSDLEQLGAARKGV